REDEHGVAPIAEYTKVLVTGVAEELDTIDSTIERYLAEDWELYRIPAVDRAIMRVAVWELLYNSEEIDLATAVSEGVELASEYSTDEIGRASCRERGLMRVGEGLVRITSRSVEVYT